MQDSNLRRHKPSDLQSDPFDRSGNSPFFLGFLVKVNVCYVECDAIGSLKVLVCSGFCFRLIAELLAGLCAELAAGVEPATC